MRKRIERRAVTEVWQAGSIAGFLLLVVGCHSGHRSNSVSIGVPSMAHSEVNLGPNHLAAAGLATITEGCEKQSFEDARNDLIVSQTGLREDVFAIRSRASSASLAFGLDDALKLEDGLRRKIKENEQPADEWKCIQQFEGYLETLTDPMVEQDKVAKELDASAFKDSTKEAQEELRREEGAEKLAPKK